jgi:hypothetical protein
MLRRRTPGQHAQALLNLPVAPMPDSPAAASIPVRMPAARHTQMIFGQPRSRVHLSVHLRDENGTVGFYRAVAAFDERVWSLPGGNLGFGFMVESKLESTWQFLAFASSVTAKSRDERLTPEQRDAMCLFAERVREFALLRTEPRGSTYVMQASLDLCYYAWPRFICGPPITE